MTNENKRPFRDDSKKHPMFKNGYFNYDLHDSFNFLTGYRTPGIDYSRKPIYIPIQMIEK